MHRIIRRVVTLPASKLPLREPDHEFGEDAQFAWHDPVGQLHLHATGRCLVGESLAPWRAAEVLRSIPVEPEGDPGADLPLVVGAMRFDPRSEAAIGSPWSGWGSCHWWIPARIVVHAHDRSVLITHRVEGGTVPPLRPLPAIFPPGTTREAYLALVGRALAAIARQEVAKLVLARSAVATSARGPFDASAQLGALVRRCPNAVVFAVGRGPQGVWLGATPEVLARVNRGRLCSAALAGSASTPAGLADAKIAREHAAVVTAMTEALAPLCADLEVALRPSPTRAARLWHLQTPISARLARAVDLLACAERLHPTPALGGSPRTAALDWLACHEGLDRGYFGAPVGWLAPDGGGVLAVGIRAALVRGRCAVAYAGAGIVAGSDPAAEWEETEAKLATVLETLTPAAAGVAEHTAPPPPHRPPPAGEGARRIAP